MLIEQMQNFKSQYETAEKVYKQIKTLVDRFLYDTERKKQPPKCRSVIFTEKSTPISLSQEQ